jgi:hypothetical protein
MYAKFESDTVIVAKDVEATIMLPVYESTLKTMFCDGNKTAVAVFKSATNVVILVYILSTNEILLVVPLHTTSIKLELLAERTVGNKTVVENDFKYIFLTPDKGWGNFATIL